MADIDDEARKTAEEIERDNPCWLVIFGSYTREFVCIPRFPVPPRTFVVAKYPGAIPPRLRQIEKLYLPDRRDPRPMRDAHMTSETTTTTTAASATRVYWCACEWAGTGLAAMQDHLDRYNDGTDAHVEMAASWPRSTR